MKRTFTLILTLLLAVSSALAHRGMDFNYNKVTASFGTEAEWADSKNYIWVIPTSNNTATFADNTKIPEKSQRGLYNLDAEYDYYYRWNYESTKNTTLGACSHFDVLDLDGMRLYVVTGTNSNVSTGEGQNPTATTAGTKHVGVNVVITSRYTDEYVTIDFGTTKDDVTLQQTLKPVSIDRSKLKDGKMFNFIKEIRVNFTNVARASNDIRGGVYDWIYLHKVKLQTTSQWNIPTIFLDHQHKGMEQGEFRIQAEDFDEPDLNPGPAHSNTIVTDAKLNGYSYSGRDPNYDNSCNETYLQTFNNNDTQLNGLQHFNGYAPGNSYVCNSQQFGFINFAQQKWETSYTGPKQSDGTAKFDDLKDFYGAWAEYTVNITEDLYADISLRTAFHVTPYAIIKGTTSGIKVSTEKVPYMQRYAGGYMIYVDGEPIKSAWEARPPVNLNDMLDPGKWIFSELPDWRKAPARAAEISHNNDYVTYSIPNLGHDINLDTWGTSWSPVYKQEMMQKLADNGKISQNVADVLSTPDYVNVKMPAGQHTIRVQSLGGQTTFDEIKLQAHKSPDTTTALERVRMTPEEDTDVNAPVEYYNLQGMRVENPSGGIFIRRQGSKTQKVVMR